MPKKTHKFKALSDIQAVVNAAPSLGEAAVKLGVDRTTLFRWIKAGKVQAPAAPTGPAAGIAPGQTPDEWAAAVRALGELDATRSTLVDLAVAALYLAKTSAQPSVQLQAMHRYQQLVKQLHLGIEPVAAAQSAPRQAAEPRVRAGGDPRAFLQAVK